MSAARSFFALEWLFPPKASPLTQDEREAAKVKRAAQLMQRVASQPSPPAVNGVVEHKEGNKLVRKLGEMELAVAQVGSKDKRNHLTLVQLPWWMQNAKIPKRSHEAATYLYNETIKFGNRADFSMVQHYIEGFFLSSRSIDGFGSDQLVRGMVGDAEHTDRNASRIQPPGPGQVAPVKEVKPRGLRLR